VTLRYSYGFVAVLGEMTLYLAQEILEFRGNTNSALGSLAEKRVLQASVS
jgi:hypothetical protein